DHDLSAIEFGRVLMSLNRRRGFKSSRLDADGDDAEVGLIASGIQSLEVALKESGARSLGEYLQWRRKAGHPVRARKSGGGKDAAYPIYPARAMIEREFDTLWARQAGHLALGEADRDAIRERLFFQRPLKPMVPGRCTFLRDETRAAKAQPLAQRFEIVQTVNNLRFRAMGRESQCLTQDQRRQLVEMLSRREDMPFSVLKSKLRLPRDATFNIESDKVKKLPGDATAKIMSDKGRFGEGWWELTPDEREAVVTELQSTVETSEVANWLSRRFRLSPERAMKTATARLPQGHLRLSLAAIKRILPVMEAGDTIDKDGRPAPVTFDKAVEAGLGLNHSILSASSRFDRLPYYGVVLDRHCVGGTGECDEPDERRLGRIPNPTVHVALNQVRATVNELIDRFGGPPSQVVLEIARELPKGAKALRELDNIQGKNQKNNDERNAAIREIGLVPSAALRLKLRLWEELDAKDPLGRACVYTGRQISFGQALSAETEIDHILPYRLTLDDGFANKVLVFREANRRKARRTPFEAFDSGAAEPGILPWSEILDRAGRLPENKRWRFAPDAMDVFEAKSGFLDRQLVDTQYISRLAREYLMCLFDRERDGCPVWVIPGRLTSMIRGKLGLNALLGSGGAKNRQDHRHHAIDAFVTGVTSRALLIAIATAAGRADDAKMNGLLDEMPAPFEKFDIEKLRRLVDAIVVSHKVDHGRNGPLHEQTAYGLVDPSVHEGCNLVRRKPVIELGDKEIDRVMDPKLRERLRSAVPAKLDKKARAAALAGFSLESGVRRVKVLVSEAKPLVLADREGKVRKALIAGDIQRVEVWQVPGEDMPRFIGVTRFDANRRDLPADFPRPHRNARKVMSIHKGDTLAIDEEGGRRLMTVRQMWPSDSNRRLILVEHNRAGKSEDIAESYGFSKLVRLGFRKVHVSPTGVVKDGGRRAR
ncbi:MAG: type II CRISPR RNA-guided endonuclease Cas9, partial [Alphaproteobacteria bacterium]|nr:type II CRISPR RNA-guided endonuclease Cas9 [Alphaproteobacteria bacterium]